MSSCVFALLTNAAVIRKFVEREITVTLRITGAFQSNKQIARETAMRSGEELRDVILWLHALDYTKQSQSAEVAFVSHDPHFIEETEEEKEEKVVQKQLKAEQKKASQGKKKLVIPKARK